MSPMILRVVVFLSFIAFIATSMHTQMMPSALAGCSDTAQPGVNWAKCQKRSVIMSGVDLTDADMSNADMAVSDLRNTTLNGSNFKKAILLRASFSGSTAKGTNFESIIASRVDFRSTTVANANFQKSEIARADFSDSTLTDIDFSKADLPRVNFEGSTITNVSFRYTNLARADLSNIILNGNIDLSGSYLFLTNIAGLDLSSAGGMQQWQIDMACGDDNTVLPSGLTKPTNWPCAAE